MINKRIWIINADSDPEAAIWLDSEDGRAIVKQGSLPLGMVPCRYCDTEEDALFVKTKFDAVKITDWSPST